MYNGPFAHFNQFSPFTPSLSPLFNPAFFSGFNGGFTSQFAPFAFFQGASQTRSNGTPWSGLTNQNQFQGQPQYQSQQQFPGQYPGQGAYSATPSGWNPVVTHTSDGFIANNSQFNGFATAPIQPTANFTPYSYQQPFFPGFSGTVGNTYADQTFNQGFNNQGFHNQGFHNQGFHNQGFHNQGFNNQGFHNAGIPNFNAGGTGYVAQNGAAFTGGFPTTGPSYAPNFGGPTFHQQPTFSVNSGWHPTNLWPATAAFTPTWNGATAFNSAGSGSPAGGYFGSYATNSYPTSGQQAFGGFPAAGFSSPGFPMAGFPLNSFSNSAHLFNSYATPGFATNGNGPSVYNGYNTFPFITNTTPGFSAWNQAGNGFPFYGSPASSFPGSFNAGASTQGWFPGQSTFPWYSQVNVAPNASNTGPVNLRPVDAGDTTGSTQQPRAIQFNRDAA